MALPDSTAIARIFGTNSFFFLGAAFRCALYAGYRASLKLVSPFMATRISVAHKSKARLSIRSLYLSQALFRNAVSCSGVKSMSSSVIRRSTFSVTFNCSRNCSLYSFLIMSRTFTPSRLPSHARCAITSPSTRSTVILCLIKFVCTHPCMPAVLRIKRTIQLWIVWSSCY